MLTSTYVALQQEVKLSCTFLFYFNIDKTSKLDRIKLTFQCSAK